MSRVQTHAESWHARSLPKIGTLVYHKPDPRHVGELVAIVHSVEGVIKWPGGWKSQFRMEEIHRAVPQEYVG